jgi:hypothetical protein
LDQHAGSFQKNVASAVDATWANGNQSCIRLTQKRYRRRMRHVVVIDRDDRLFRSNQVDRRFCNQADRYGRNDARLLWISRFLSYFLLECDGLLLRLVDAIARNSFSLIELSIDFDAPFNSLLPISPRLADSAAPAAICCALDFAGMIVSL